MSTLRVVVAEDHYLVREGVRRILDDEPDLVVVATVASATELERAAEREDPDVVVTDIRMPPDEHLAGLTAALRIRAVRPGVGIVVLSQYADPRYAMALFADGTAGVAYLLKERLGDPDKLVGAVRAVAAGESVIDPDVVGALVARSSHRDAHPLASLTERERGVLQLMAEGRTNAGIATRLHISQSSVEKHSGSIFAKLGLAGEGDVHRRVAAVLTYLDGRVAGVGSDPPVP
ncbi:MAG: response regulator transcription factor [Ornithinibacter sp.]